MHALQCGFDPSKIIFDSPSKTRREIEFALEKKVWINADNFSEVDVMQNIIDEKGIDASAVRCGVRRGTAAAGLSTSPFLACRALSSSTSSSGGSHRAGASSSSSAVAAATGIVAAGLGLSQLFTPTDIAEAKSATFSSSSSSSSPLTLKRSTPPAARPGHGLKFAGNMVPLPQVHKREDLPTFTLEYFRKGSDDRVWVALDGGVYDMTPFLDAHPGGAHRIMMVNSRDGRR